MSFKSDHALITTRSHLYHRAKKGGFQRKTLVKFSKKSQIRNFFQKFRKFPHVKVKGTIGDFWKNRGFKSDHASIMGRSHPENIETPDPLKESTDCLSNDLNKDDFSQARLFSFSALFYFNNRFLEECRFNF